jgi:two-component system, chemotaxis family, CheB/CheR fusion protein
MNDEVERGPVEAPDDGAEGPDDASMPRFPIVGIGASAGGLAALEELTGRLAKGAMAYVVLQHLAPGHESALTEILARGTAMEVVTVADAMPVEAERIYVAPSNVDVVIHRGVLRLMTPPPERRGPRLSIDGFLRSLAADQGRLAIGVILSGAGSDGTLGLQAIKEEGGITFVQEPSTAGQPSMPESAIDSGCADFCLSPAEIGEELMRLSTHPYVVAEAPRRIFDVDDRSKLFVLLRSHSGVDFAAYKQSTIERRIQRRMALQKIDQLPDYVKLVQSNPAELAALYSDLLIAVTSFFRDGAPFEALATLVFPRIMENRRRGDPIRIWVAGCASGEEAFSIAIALLEYLGDRASDHRIQIFATDIDDASLARARQAVYPENIEMDVSPERLQRFFSSSDKGYQVRRSVRDMVVFARHNLGRDPPFSRIDLVSCRNVLIYMQQPLQRRVMSVFHYALKPDGFMLLGTSESVGEAADLFALVERKVKIYRKKNVATTAPFDPSVGPGPVLERPARPLGQPRGLGFLQLADRAVLEQYGPPGVLIDDKLDILQYRGKTGRFFEPLPGVATTNLMKLARPELLPELSATVRAALDGQRRVVSGPVRLWHDNAVVTVHIDVTPLLDTGAIEPLLLVLFDEKSSSKAPDEEPVEAPPRDPRVEDLERELIAAKEYLQATIEELEVTNEELQSSNEELQSSNEELQSTNEELETSKEEMQSTNEELITLNEELQNRMSQLNDSNDDLENVLGMASGALVLVGPDLCIRRFSAAAAKLLDLIPGDVGRPVTYLRSVMRVRDIEQTIAASIDQVTPRRQRVLSVDGDWYEMSIAPYRTADHTIRGAVIELARVAEGESAAGRSRELRGLGELVLGLLPQALALVDTQMRVTWANGAFLDLFEVGQDIFGRPLEDFWEGRKHQPKLWTALEAAVAHGRPVEGSSIAEPYGEPLRGPVRFSARRLPEDDRSPPLTLLTVERESQP